MFSMSSFGSPAPATATSSAASVFGGFGMASMNQATPTSGAATDIFGNAPKPQQSAFESQTAASPFGARAASSTSPFGAPQSTPGSIFGSTAVTSTSASIFSGEMQQAAQSPQSVFATANQSPSMFANSKQEPSVFGGSPFGAAVSPATSGGSIFGGSAFGATANSPQAASGGSIFGGGFGGGFSQVPNANTSQGFGSPPSAFGGVPQQNNNNFGNNGFASGAPSINQTGFGASPNSSFASPAFGATPSFGGAATFGSPKGGFGSFANSSFATAPAPQQGNPLFESLGSASTGMTFGNLAQNANTASPPAPKPAFGGGGSFSNWR